MLGGEIERWPHRVSDEVPQLTGKDSAVERATAAIEEIAEALRERLSSSGKESSPDEAYQCGIDLCNEMIQRLRDPSVAQTRKSLFAQFSRYAADSMPWDPGLWQTIEQAQQEVGQCLPN